MGPWTETESLGEISPEGSEEKTRNDVIISGVDESLPSPIIIKCHYLKESQNATKLVLGLWEQPFKSRPSILPVENRRVCLSSFPALSQCFILSYMNYPHFKMKRLRS